MAEGQAHSEEVQTGSACEETLIGVQSSVQFSKIPVQPESSQSGSLSTSSGDVSSPVFRPQRRRLRSECSDSEEDEKHKDSTTADVSPQPIRRRRANA